jgi:hypothetical protein
MTFFVSESLKDRIDEETLSEDAPKKKIASTEKLYCEITTAGSSVYCPVELIEFKKSKTVIVIDVPDSSSIFEKIINTNLWDSVHVKISNDNASGEDAKILNANSDKCQIVEVRKSLLGYNYVATIVIHK